MAFMITSQCINCSACAMDCPVRAIGRGPSQFVIDPNVCVECDGYFDVPRCSRACPVDACVPERAEHLYNAAALAHRGSAPVVMTRDRPHGRVLTAT